MNERAVPPPAPSSPERMLRWFEFQHLPPPLRDVSMLYADLAHAVCRAVPPGPERTVALRKLLESKDAVVRAVLEGRPQP